MPDEESVDAEKLLKEINEGERVLMELIDEPEPDREEIKSEVRTLVRISKKLLHQNRRLRSESRELADTIEDDFENLRARSDAVLDDLLGDDRN